MSGIVKKILSPKTYRFLVKYYHEWITGYVSKAYSQEGEDLILRRIFAGQKSGFFVDVGAHHPLRFSNTYLLYKQGWRGINIDCSKGAMKAFSKKRKRDINIDAAVSDKKEKIPYYSFEEPAINSFVLNAEEEQSSLAITEIETQTLTEILDSHFPKATDFDVLSVDVEGFDLKVLMSNNWEVYRPKIVLVESLSFDLEKYSDSELFQFMQSKKYSLFAKTVNTLFFLRGN